MLHSVRHAITLVEELWSFLPLLFDTAGSGLLELIKSSKGHLSCFNVEVLGLGLSQVLRTSRLEGCPS